MFAAIDRALAPGGLVVFGELHGTREIPQFLARAAARAAERGRVTVAVEIPADVQPGVDAFLATTDRAALFVPSPFWDYRDGRAGEGLVDLLTALAALRAVDVLCFDGVFASGDARDAGMARTILDALRPDATTLVSCGNLHARSTLPWMTSYLRVRQPSLVALDAAIDGGAAYLATESGSGVTTLGPSNGDPRRGVELHAARDEHGFDGIYHVGPVTPSLPLHHL